MGNEGETRDISNKGKNKRDEIKHPENISELLYLRLYYIYEEKTK